MNILVTGGAGFIGSHLVNTLLTQGHDVFVVDDLSSGKRKNVPKGATFIKGDIRKLAKMRKLPKTIDAVFHLAAQIDVRHSVSDPAHDAAVNIEGTINVLMYAVQARAKKVVFSSSGGAIYGACDLLPTTEESSCQSSSPYGVAKYAAEQYIQLFSRLHNLPYVILRYSNVYGPGQDGSKESGVVAIFSKLAKQGKPMTIFGDGEQTRDYVFVGDVVDANLKTLTYEDSGVFNIGTGVETSVNELAKAINRVSPQAVHVVHAPARTGEERRSCLDISKAKSALGWTPKMSLEDGLRMTMPVV